MRGHHYESSDTEQSSFVVKVSHPITPDFLQAKGQRVRYLLLDTSMVTCKDVGIRQSGFNTSQHAWYGVDLTAEM